MKVLLVHIYLDPILADLPTESMHFIIFINLLDNFLTRFNCPNQALLDLSPILHHSVVEIPVLVSPVPECGIGTELPMVITVIVSDQMLLQELLIKRL